LKIIILIYNTADMADRIFVVIVCFWVTCEGVTFMPLLVDVSRIMLCYIMLHHVMSCHVMSCFIVWEEGIELVCGYFQSNQNLSTLCAYFEGEVCSKLYVYKIIKLKKEKM